MSQLTYAPLFSGNVAASPGGAVRSSNVVTITTSAAHGMDSRYVGYEVLLKNITGVGGSNFNGDDNGRVQPPNIGRAVITAIPSTTTFQFASTLANDTGGGGTWSVSKAQFTDLADSLLAGDNPLTDVELMQISHNAFFAAARLEVFDCGYFQSADNVFNVSLPTSPIDGYPYGLGECLWFLQLASSRQPAAGFVSGQNTFPALASSDVGTGNLVCAPYILKTLSSSGVLTVQISFATSGPATQGTVHVFCIAQRRSVQNQA